MKLFKEKDFIFLISWSLSCLLIYAVADRKSCDLQILNECSVNETCKQIVVNSTKGYCDCKINYRREKDLCLRISDSPAPPPKKTTVSPPIAEPASAPLHPDNDVGSDVLTTTIVVLVAMSATVAILVLLAKRYKWFDRLYELRVRRYNTVLVSSLNDDDAPIQ